MGFNVPQNPGSLQDILRFCMVSLLAFIRIVVVESSFHNFKAVSPHQSMNSQLGVVWGTL